MSETTSPQEKIKLVNARYMSDEGIRKVTLRYHEPEKKEVKTEEQMMTGYFGLPQGIGYPYPAGKMDKKEKSYLFEREEEEKKLLEGMSFPDMKEFEPEELEETTEVDVTGIDITYPLSPPYASAHIHFDTTKNELIYDVIEPEITEKEKRQIIAIKEYIREKLDINFAHIRKAEALQYLEKIFDRALDFFKVSQNKDVLKYYIVRDFIGLEKIEPLLNDKRIEDISCDGVNTPIYIYHRDTNLGSIKTNIIFTNKDELDLFTNKLAERCGSSVSFNKPLIDATLPDGSRVQATLGSDIARHGSNFTIRMFTENPLTPTDLINFKTSDIKIMAYLWFLIEYGMSILICGGTASGKTSLLNALSLFIKPQLKIVSIEDTAELRLPHAHWIPEVARTSIAIAGQVDMFQLLKESLRQRPDYIIVGEVRGKEAYVLFQQMAVGHAGLSTIHAESFMKLMDRLTSAPINLAPSLIQNLDVIIFVKRIKKGRKYYRRISSVIEIAGYSPKNKIPIINKLFEWNPKTDHFDIIKKSVILKKVLNNTNMEETDIIENLTKKAVIIDWMLKREVYNYRKVGSLMNMYYTAPEFLLSRIEGI